MPADSVPTLLTRDERPASELWALDPTITHLNHGSFGGVATTAVAAQRELQRELESSPLTWFLGEPERIAAARGLIAPWLNVPAEQLALVPNASGGVTAALQSLPIPAGSEVVITNHAYGAVAMSVHRQAAAAGAAVRIAEVDLAAEADAAYDAIWAAVTSRTSLIVLDHITSATARRLPVGAVCAAARERGIVTVVDGAHAPLLLTDPVNEADADVWVGNLHKFGCAPRGTAVLIARPEVADRLYPLIDSWGTPDPYPDRFDRQGTEDHTAWIATPVAVQTIEDAIGWDRVRDHATAIADRAVQRVGEALSAAFGYDPTVEVGMPVGPIRLVGLPDRSPDVAPYDERALQRALLAQGIETTFTSFGGRTFWRVTGHAYVTEADLDRVAAAVVDTIRALG